MVIPKDGFLDKLQEYTPAEAAIRATFEGHIPSTNIIKLGNNENPRGTSPKAIDAVIKYLSTQKLQKNCLNVYPDLHGNALSASLKRKFHEIGTAEVVVGNGLNNIIEGLARLFLRPGDKALMHTPVYQFFEQAINWAHGEAVFFKTTAENNFQLDTEQFIKQIDNSIKLIFICNPNNPTGNLLPWEQIESIINAAEKFGSMVYLDETYVDFAVGKSSHIDKVKFHRNLIVGRTFSKAYGLAALRVGWAVIPRGILHLFRKVQAPYAVNTLAMIGAEAALKDDEFYQETVKINSEGLLYLTTNLFKHGFKVFPSNANYLAFLANKHFHNKAMEVCNWCLQNGIVIRNASSFRDAPIDLTRITVGLPEQNQKFIEVISKKL